MNQLQVRMNFVSQMELLMHYFTTMLTVFPDFDCYTSLTKLCTRELKRLQMDPEWSSNSARQNKHWNLSPQVHAFLPVTCQQFRPNARIVKAVMRNTCFRAGSATENVTATGVM